MAIDHPDLSVDKSKRDFADTSIITNFQGKQGENIEKNKEEKKSNENWIEKIEGENPSIFNMPQKARDFIITLFLQTIEHKTKKDYYGKPRYCQTCKAYKVHFIF